MAIHTIETIVDVDENRQIVVQLPRDVSVGKHKLTAVIDEAVVSGEKAVHEPLPTPWQFPTLDGTHWPEGMIVRREDLYAE